MKAEDVMTTRVITVTENQTKQQAARLLAQHRIHLVDAFDELGNAVLRRVFVRHSLRHLCVS